MFSNVEMANGVEELKIDSIGHDGDIFINIFRIDVRITDALFFIAQLTSILVYDRIGN